MPEPFKIGLVGAGGISRAHSRAFQQFPEQVQLAAVCDIREAAAAQRAQEAGAGAVYTDLDRMLAEADIDAVDICTSHDQHLDTVLAAARAGKHVLVEKPMAVSMDECRRMVDAAADAGVTYMVAQCQRYNPSYRGVRKLVRGGELGAIRAVRFDSNQNLPAFLPTEHWLFDAEKAGGGIVISVSVHRIDLMRYLVGDIVRVTGACRTTSPIFRNGAENYAAAVLEFENGAIGDLFATYTGYRMPWGEQFMIYGDDGAIHAVPALGDYQGPAMKVTKKDDHRIEGWDDQYRGWAPVEPDREGLPSDDEFVNEILHFADCCRSGREPDSSGRDNLKTMAVIFGIYESSRTGKPVDVTKR